MAVQITRILGILAISIGFFEGNYLEQVGNSRIESADRIIASLRTIDSPNMETIIQIEEALEQKRTGEFERELSRPVIALMPIGGALIGAASVLHEQARRRKIGST